MSETPDGHLSIRPVEQGMLESWAKSREGLDTGEEPHVLTKMVQLSWVTQSYTPKK